MLLLRTFINIRAFAGLGYTRENNFKDFRTLSAWKNWEKIGKKLEIVTNIAATFLSL